MKKKLIKVMAIAFVAVMLFSVAVFANAYSEVKPTAPLAADVDYASPTEASPTEASPTEASPTEASPCEDPDSTVIIINDIDNEFINYCKIPCGCWLSRFFDSVKCFFDRIFNLVKLNLNFNIGGKIDVAI